MFLGVKEAVVVQRIVLVLVGVGVVVRGSGWEIYQSIYIHNTSISQAKPKIMLDCLTRDADVYIPLLSYFSENS